VKIVVVTASIGEGRRKLLTPQVVNPNVRYVAFADRPMHHPVWTIKRVDRKLADRCRDAKRYKVLLSTIIQDADASIWVDRHCRIMCDPVEVFERFTEDVGVFAHFRNCCYHEARACRKRKKDSEAIINATVERLRSEQWPPAAGLYYGGFLLRRHTEGERAFSRLWWDRISAGTRRDQITLPFCLHKSEVSYRIFPRSEIGSFFRIRGK